MSAIRGKNTAPERAVRAVLRKMGLRGVSHSRRLPGTPDIALTKAKTAVFVHGCFWHQHPRCRRRSMPSTNRKYWVSKLERNVERFVEVRRALRKQGWKVVVVWECQTKNLEKLASGLGTKLGVQTYE